MKSKRVVREEETDKNLERRMEAKETSLLE
jgi:hypothetical protein